LTDDDLLHIAEKIFHGVRDSETIQHGFLPLWEHPILVDTLIWLLKNAIYLKSDCCSMPETLCLEQLIENRKSFENVCMLLCPGFDQILDGNRVNA
jgi:hypothetical protein